MHRPPKGSAGSTAIARANTARHTVVKYPTAGAALFRINELTEGTQQWNPQERMSITYEDVGGTTCMHDMWPLGDVSYEGAMSTISYYMDTDGATVATWYGDNSSEEGSWQFNLAGPALDKLPSHEKLAETGGASEALTIEGVNALCAGFLLVTSSLV